MAGRMGKGQPDRDRWCDRDATVFERRRLFIAGDDEIIGAASGLRLANGYSGPKEIQVFPGAHHNDVAEQTPDWWREVFSFWQKNVVLRRGF